MKVTAIRPRAWTEDENLILKRLYPDHGAAVVAEVTGRSIASVDKQASRLGVKRNRVMDERQPDLAEVWLRKAWR